MPRPLRPLALAVAVALSAHGSALAQEPGVTFDDGPSSKEYAIPLDAARAQTRTKAPARASTGSATEQPAAATAAATGGDQRSSDGSPKSSSSSKRNDDHSRDANPAAAPVYPTRTRAPALDTRAAATSDGLGAGVVIAGLAAAALALGALGGLVLRRRRTPGDAY